MATFTDIYKQELKSKGVLGSLGSAGFKRAKERLDPRNILFGGSGIVSATGQKIFGKGYSAIDKSAGKKLSDSGAFNGEIKSEALNALLVSSQKQEAQLSIIAKNTMNNNAMARDMNVMRQNIMKLVTMGGGKASRGSDMFFKDAAAREKSYESQFGKEKTKTLTPIESKTPTQVKNKGDESSSIFSKVLTALGPFGIAISALIAGINSGVDIIKGFFGILSNLLPSMETIITSIRSLASTMSSMLLSPLGLLTSGLAAAGIAIYKFSDTLLNRAEQKGGAKGRELESQMQTEMMQGAMDPMGTSFVTGTNAMTGEKLLTPDDERIKQAQKEHQNSLNAERMAPYKSRAGVGRDTSPSREMDPGKQKLLDFIAQKESGAYGYNALVYGNGTPKTADLTNMTLQEVFDYQSGMISRGHASSAVGRYQFINETLREFAKKAGVSSSEKFTPEVQDRIAGALLDQVGYQKLISGKMTMEDFQNRLAGRWASLPRTDGTSQYAGKNGNKVLTTSDTLKNVITASMTTPTTGATLASASTASSDMRASLSAPTSSAPITISTSNSVKNSQAVVANKSQVGDYSFQASTLSTG